jgi:hypothetical protein
MQFSDLQQVIQTTGFWSFVGAAIGGSLSGYATMRVARKQLSQRRLEQETELIVRTRLDNGLTIIREWLDHAIGAIRSQHPYDEPVSVQVLNTCRKLGNVYHLNWEKRLCLIDKQVTSLRNDRVSIPPEVHKALDQIATEIVWCEEREERYLRSGRVKRLRLRLFLSCDLRNTFPDVFDDK